MSNKPSIVSPQRWGPAILIGTIFFVQAFAVVVYAAKDSTVDAEFKGKTTRMDKTYARELINNNRDLTQKAQQTIIALGDKKDAASVTQRKSAQADIAKAETEVGALPEIKDSGVKSALSNFLLQTNDNTKALAQANEAVDLSLQNNDPPATVADALRARAMANAATGNYAGANADAKRILKMFPNDELADRIEKLTRGHAPIKINLPKNTPPPAPIQELLDVARRSPINRPAGFDATVAHTKEAESGLEMGDYQKMYDEATMALEKLPGNPKAYMQRAFASLMMKKFDQTIKDATEGLKAKPGSASLLGLRAAAYNETGKPKDALEDAARAVEDNPKDPFAWLQKGLAREKLNEGNDEFLGDIKTAAELNPEFEHFYTEALGRRQQGGSSAPAAPVVGSLFQRWILPVATVALCVLLVIVTMAKRLFKREPKVVAAASKDGPEGKLLAGQYRIVRELGRGGMGIVYEAWDTTLERPVALKRIMEDLKSNPEEAGRLLKEAKTVASLRHDNIVVIHNAFEDDGDVYCVFEMMGGETLQDFMGNRARIEPVESTTYLAAIASALDYAHKLKVIHRDLKPANIMLENGKVKIMDFGIARRMKGGKGVTMTEMVIGTPAYMAPELQFGEVSPESDLYALAIVAYQMLTGRLPFEGEGTQQDKFEGRISPASTYVKNAPGIDQFFKKALAPDRKDRFHSGAEFVEAYRKSLV